MVIHPATLPACMHMGHSSCQDTPCIYYEQLQLLTISKFATFRAAKNSFFSSGKKCTVIITLVAAEWKGQRPQRLALQWPWSR